MIKRILVDFLLLKTIHPNLFCYLFQLESQLGGDYSSEIKSPKGSPSTHTLMSYFQALAVRTKLEPVPSLECSRELESSLLKGTRVFQSLPQSADFICYKRVFNEPEEHQRGRVYAAFDPATSTAVVFREYHD